MPLKAEGVTQLVERGSDQLVGGVGNAAPQQVPSRAMQPHGCENEPRGNDGIRQCRQRLGLDGAVRESEARSGWLVLGLGTGSKANLDAAARSLANREANPQTGALPGPQGGLQKLPLDRCGVRWQRYRDRGLPGPSAQKPGQHAPGRKNVGGGDAELVRSDVGQSGKTFIEGRDVPVRRPARQRAAGRQENGPAPRAHSG